MSASTMIIEGSEVQKMSLLVIAIIYALDIIARTYITSEGIRYEAVNGKSKWFLKRK